MCGICGIIHSNKPVNVDELTTFTNFLTHRGPDDFGIYIKNNIGLGHRRLSILDVSPAGKNPMIKKFDDGKELIIVFNGEIFNFIELKKELSSYGYKFNTETDTEVILAAYHKYGKDCLHKFNGMWAFAIYNPQDNSFFISRDRFGIKPLYFCIDGNSFYFSSEIKGFLALSNFSFQFDDDEVKAALSNPVGYEGLTPKTIFKNIFKLLPGHNLIIDNRLNIYYEKWWYLENNLLEVPRNYFEQVEQFKNILFDAVRIRLRSDVNIGTSLSGGVDSSTIACLVQYLSKEKSERQAPDTQSVFAAKFPNSFLDESYFIDYLAQEKKFNLKNLIVTSPTEDDIIKSIFISESIIVSSLHPIIKIYELMRNNNTFVTLDGHGGDELLCGYTFYLNWPIRQFKQYLQHNFERAILPAILRNYDIASMANGVEVRMPLLDHRLVVFTFSIPEFSIIGNGYTKRILRDSVNEIVPYKIIYRQSKIGFNSPLNNWFNDVLNKFILNIFENNFFKNNPYWNYQNLYDNYFYKTKNKLWQNTIDDFNKANNLWIKINLTFLYSLYIQNNWKNYV